MKTALPLSAIALLVLLCKAKCQAQTVELRLSAPKTTWRLKDYPRFAVTLRNNSAAPLTLVEPGDGSESGWRTPVVSWSVLPAKSVVKHPTHATPGHILRCGNMNPLAASEIFTLAPHQSRSLGGWLGVPPLRKPGRYRVKFFYANIPGQPWVDEGQNDALLIQRVRRSSQCSLASNEIILTIVR